jgi:hypothetical protein
MKRNSIPIRTTVLTKENGVNVISAIGALIRNAGLQIAIPTTPTTPTLVALTIDLFNRTALNPTEITLRQTRKANFTLSISHFFFSFSF